MFDTVLIDLRPKGSVESRKQAGSESYASVIQRRNLRLRNNLTRVCISCNNLSKGYPRPLNAVAIRCKQMATNTEFYTIVVVGNMNPRIHTPAWYRLVDLISDDEMEQANKPPSNDPANFSYFVVSGLLARWQTNTIGIACHQAIWEVSTTNVDCLERLRSITEQVFDHLLKQTPVNALGINFNYERVTEIAHVGRHLASNLAKARFGLDDNGLISGELSLRRSLQGRNFLVTIRPSAETGRESMVAVSNNFEYRFPNTGVSHFKLKDTFSASFSEDLEEAERQTSRVVQAINQSRGQV